MKLRLALGLTLTTLFAGSLVAAPAPFANPNQKGPGEVVLAAGNAERTRLALRYLRSTTFLDQLLATRTVGELACLKGVRDRRAWLAARLKVEAKAGALVQVRVKDCRLGEALVILKEAIAQVAKKPQATSARARAALQERKVVRLLLLQRVQALGAMKEMANEDVARMEEVTARYEFEANPLVVKRPPGRAGR
jgi:hypothetical protein